MALTAPWLAIIAAVAGVAVKIKLEVVREVDASGSSKPANETGEVPLGGD